MNLKNDKGICCLKIIILVVFTLELFFVFEVGNMFIYYERDFVEILFGFY